MGRKYYGNFLGVATGTTKAMIGLQSASTIKPKIWEINIGSSATPADQAAQLVVQRFTAVGTPAGTFTATAADPGDPASLATVNQGAYSVQPTITASSHLLVITVNQRATYRWVTNPGYELICPCVANNGLALNCISSTSTQTQDGSIGWEE